MIILTMAIEQKSNWMEDNMTEKQQDKKTTGQQVIRTERQQNHVGKQGTWHDI